MQKALYIILTSIGLALALLSHALWFRLFVDYGASLSTSKAQASWRLFRFVGEYAPLSGALVGGIVGCALAYAFRRTNAA